jgi:hypothetical protein
MADPMAQGQVYRNVTNLPLNHIQQRTNPLGVKVQPLARNVIEDCCS